MYDHRYPTKTCGRSNPTVRSSWDNVSSPSGGRISREGIRRLPTPRRSGARVDGMANSGALLINVVRTSKPKALRGLNQKVRGQVRVLSFYPHAAVAPPAERHDLTRSVAGTERGKPVAPPSRGQGRREASCRGCGQRMGEQANAVL